MEETELVPFPLVDVVWHVDGCRRDSERRKPQTPRRLDLSREREHGNASLLGEDQSDGAFAGGSRRAIVQQEYAMDDAA